MLIEQPLFTVATITYNSGKWVRQAIESVLSSSYTDFEYIIADDCSSDDTWEIVQQYQDSRIVAFRNEFNIREYPNRNKVLQHAKGKYILYIDGDDILYKHTLRNLAEYISAFPTAEMIWGVLTPLNKYAVLPYLFEPVQTLQLLYDYSNYIGVIGFTETLFSVEALKREGGFSNKFAIGDIYIRKKLALTCKVLFVPIGFSYWRSTPGQASSNLGVSYKFIIESMQIDLLILNDSKNPLATSEKLQLEYFVKSSFLRRTVRNVLLKGRVFSFIRLYKKVGLNLLDLFFLFKRIKPFDEIIDDIAQPLMNEYNFKIFNSKNNLDNDYTNNL
jgi:glycosyltransferase involved in cell wall biosynthesis